jgi:multidrug efflux pump
MDNNFELTQGQRLDRAYKKEKGSIFGFFIKNYRFTYLILISIVAMGFFALFSLPREANPEIKVPFAVVNTFLPGGSPEDVEDLLTNKIEDKIKNVEDLKQFDSTSGNGLSSIFVEFVAEADLQQSFQKLREAVDRAGPELPSEAEAPVVTEIRFNDFAIVTYSLVGDCSREILESCTDNLKSALEDVDGVSKVEVVGKPDREFQIIVDQSKLASFNLSISQIAGAIRSANITLPVGDIEVDQFNYNVRIKGKISRIEDLRQIVVANLGGSPVYLSDIGQVIDGEEEENTLSRIGTSGERSAESVSLMVYKKTGGNIIKIIEATDERIETLKASGGIAEELKIIQSNDNSVFIKEDLGVLARSGMQTMVLIFILLLLALGYRSAMITALSVPIAFLMSFIWLQVQGETLNGMVLFALVLSLGLMVDNSIVVIEGIVEYLGDKYYYSPLQAATLSVWNFKWPIIAGTMTTVSAFIPMLLVSGIMGEYMGILPKTISATLLSSLFVALVIIPTMAARRVKKQKISTIERPQRFNVITKLINKLRPGYAAFMRDLLPNKKKRRRAILLAWVLFFVSIATMVTGIMRVELFPSIDIRFMQVNVELPTGSDLSSTEQITRNVEEIVAELPGLQTYVTSIGVQGSFDGGSSLGSHLSSIVINLTDKSKRDKKSFELAEDLREQTKSIKGAKITVEEAGAGPPTGAPIEVRIFGPEIEGLAVLSDNVIKTLEEMDGTLNVKSNLQTSTGEFVFTIDRESASFYGFNTGSIASAVRTAIYGATASTVTIDGEDVDIIVRYDEEKFSSVDDVENILLASPRGDAIALSQLATVSLEPSLLGITHRNGDRIVRVTSNIEKGENLKKILEEFETKKTSILVPQNYSISVGGETEDIEKSFREIFTSMIVAVLLISAILILMFNSFRQPFIIIFTVPLAIIGVVFGLNILRLPFSLPAFIGIVSLAGIVVNDAIVLVDRINKNIKGGMDFFESIVEGGQARMQPIFLTSATTIAGIFPLIFASELWKGLAWTVIWGLAFSTVLTLVMVPILYVSLCKDRKSY